MEKTNVIETDRLVLRPFTLDDVSDLYRMSQEDGMAKWIPDQVYEDEEEAKGVVEFLMAQYVEKPTPNEAPYVIGIVLKDNDGLIGHVGLSPLGEDVELGYAIAEKQQGNGYATEAVEAMTHWALHELGLPSVLGVVDSNNIASCKVLENASYRFIDEKVKEAIGREGMCRTYRKKI